MNKLMKVIAISFVIIGLTLNLSKKDNTSKEYVLTDRDFETSSVLNIDPKEVKLLMEKFGKETGAKLLDKALAVESSNTIQKLANYPDVTQNEDASLEKILKLKDPRKTKLYIAGFWLGSIRDYELTKSDLETASILNIKPSLIKEIKSRYSNLDRVDEILKESVARINP